MVAIKLVAMLMASALCSALVLAAPAGKTNTKSNGNGPNKSPFAAIKQQQQQQAQQQQQFQQQPQSSNGQFNNQLPNQIAPVFTSRPVAPVSQNQQQQQQQQQQQEPDSSSQQQQQEIDPSAAAQEENPSVIAQQPATSGSGNNGAVASLEEREPRPEPYAFNYAFNSGDGLTAGASSRAEQQDTNGVVTGFYTLQGDDGRDRRVDYTADASGFRATVRTNELGTDAKDSADVKWIVAEPSVGQLQAAALATEISRQKAAAAGPANLVNVLPIQPQINFGQSIPQPILTFPSASSFVPQQQQQQQASLPLASSNRPSIALPSKQNARVNPPREQFGSASSASKTSVQQATAADSQISQQLVEPFEQIRQTELKARSVRQARHAPFYLFSAN